MNIIWAKNEKNNLKYCKDQKALRLLCRYSKYWFQTSYRMSDEIRKSAAMDLQRARQP